jgi:hypothetical protein
VVIWFLQSWALLGIASVLFRNRMIFQEDNQGYRLMLLVLTVPARVAVDFIVSLFRSSISTYWFFADSWNGIDPAERNTRPDQQGEKK